MKYTVYVKKEIKSEADLPKEYLRLISHYKDEENVFYRTYEPPYDSDEIIFITANIDWYLQPIELDLPDDEDIEKYSFGRSENPAQESLFDRGYMTGLKHGAIWIRDKIKDQLK